MSEQKTVTKKKKRKRNYVDEYFAAFLNFSTLGLGYLVIKDKKRFFWIMGIQIALLIIAGPIMLIGAWARTLIWLIYLGIAGWSIYDVFTTARAINEHINSRR